MEKRERLLAATEPQRAILEAGIAVVGSLGGGGKASVGVMAEFWQRRRCVSQEVGAQSVRAVGLSNTHIPVTRAHLCFNEFGQLITHLGHDRRCCWIAVEFVYQRQRILVPVHACTHPSKCIWASETVAAGGKIKILLF
jgi:hypothetical protein